MCVDVETKRPRVYTKGRKKEQRRARLKRGKEEGERREIERERKKEKTVGATCWWVTVGATCWWVTYLRGEVVACSHHICHHSIFF